MNIHQEGDLELGADPVGGRDEDRMAVLTAFELEKAAEAADAGQQPGTRRLARKRLDQPHQAIRRGDIDSGFFVIHRFTDG